MNDQTVFCNKCEHLEQHLVFSEEADECGLFEYVDKRYYCKRNNRYIEIDETKIPMCACAYWEERTKEKMIYKNIQEANNTSIKDSGGRRQFETGAVRDIQEGKGRCDLLPLDVVTMCYSNDEAIGDPDCPQSWVFYHLDCFKCNGQICHLRKAIKHSRIYTDMETMFLEVSKHFEEGAKKYDENNWMKGIPTRCYIDSAVRHYLKYLRGDKDEPHDRAFVWNILCCIWTCKKKPELNDYAEEARDREKTID